MPLTLYALSGSPYVWRVWLALEHKGIDHRLKFLSYDAGDFKGAELAALNPRRRVPVIVEDDGFALHESAAIVEYLEEAWPQSPRLLADAPRQRALQRRLVREADQYFATAMEHLVEALLFTPQPQWDEQRIAAAVEALQQECQAWASRLTGDYLAGDTLSVADFTLFPQLALVQRMATRKPGMLPPDLLGPALAAWAQRMAALPVVQKTWPPHWRT